MNEELKRAAIKYVQDYIAEMTEKTIGQKVSLREAEQAVEEQLKSIVGKYYNLNNKDYRIVSADLANKEWSVGTPNWDPNLDIVLTLEWIPRGDRCKD